MEQGLTPPSTHYS